MSGLKLEFEDRFKWEVNHPLPKGGPLRTADYQLFTSARTKGQGTVQDPAVETPSNPPLPWLRKEPADALR